MRALTIAIDGPSGAGKGTVARAIAAKLGYRHVDSGAMYRAVGWKASRDRVPFDDEARVAEVAARTALTVAADGVSVDGVDVTKAIRTPEIDRAATAVARLPKVRAVLVERQRALGASFYEDMGWLWTASFGDADAEYWAIRSGASRSTSMDW